MGFEWDARKAALNLTKHGVDFLDAAQIFSGPITETIDNRRDYGELRLISVGRFGDEIFSVVNTLRGENRRIISARRANEKEKRKYRQVQQP